MNIRIAGSLSERASKSARALSALNWLRNNKSNNLLSNNVLHQLLQLVHTRFIINPLLNCHREEQTLFRYFCFTSLSLFILNIFRRRICSPDTIICISITEC